MTKTNKKNIILGLGIITICTAIFGTSTALYFLAGDLESIANKKEYIIRSNTPLTLDGYYFDESATYGSILTKSPNSLMAANMIRRKSSGETKFVKDSSGKTKVSVPSTSKLVLELVAEIVLTFESNSDPGTGKTIQQVIFNNDKAEINPADSYTELPETVTLISNDKKSINSEYFHDLLIGKAGLDINGELDPSKTGYTLKSLGFTTSGDTYWVDHNGNKTEYKIVPRDFWYSYMRTWLYDTKFRRANGGSKELDTYFINASATGSRFQDEKEYPNDYLFELFGISSIDLEDEKKAIQNVNIDGKDKEMFTIQAIEGVENSSFSSIIDKSIVDSFLFSAAPSEFIDELVANDKNNYDGLEIKGLAKRFGIYTYGQKRSDNLFASEYIPISGHDNRIIFVRNKFFANEQCLEDETALEKIIFEYSTSPTFKDQLFTNYLEKRVSEMPYSGLTQQQKIKIFGVDGNEETAFQNGLLQTKQLNKSQLVQRTLLSVNPRKLENDDNQISEQYYFNDEYSKIMYGAPAYKPTSGEGNYLASGNVSTSDTYFNGTGFQLRTLLNAAVNWYTFNINSWQGTKKLWLNHAAPNAQYNSTTSSDASPIDFPEVNNVEYFYTDENSSEDKKVTITEADMKKVFEEYQHDVNLQYRTDKFDQVQQLIKKLLDDNGVTEDKPLVWSIVYPYADASSQTIKVQQIEHVIKTIKSLDSRLKPEIFLPSNRDTLLDSISRNKSISDFNGWAYDYEGIGSYLDGVATGTGVGLFGAFSLYSDKNNSLIRNRHPEFTKLSDAMREYLDPKLPVGKKMEDWVNFTNDNYNNVNAFFGDFKISVEISKFFLIYTNNISTDQITKLIVELNSIGGFAMEADNAINDPNAASFSLVLAEYLYPTPKSGILYLSDVKVGDKND